MTKIIGTKMGCALMGALSSAAYAGTGNNLPPGPHFELQVIAFENCPAGDFTDSNRHEIAVKADYQVISGTVPSSCCRKTSPANIRSTFASSGRPERAWASRAARRSSR